MRRRFATEFCFDSASSTDDLDDRVSPTPSPVSHQRPIEEAEWNPDETLPSVQGFVHEKIEAIEVGVEGYETDYEPQVEIRETMPSFDFVNFVNEDLAKFMNESLAFILYIGRLAEYDAVSYFESYRKFQDRLALDPEVARIFFHEFSEWLPGKSFILPYAHADGEGYWEVVRANRDQLRYTKSPYVKARNVVSGKTAHIRLYFVLAGLEE